MSNDTREDADKEIAKLVRDMSAAPMGNGLGMWEAIATHLHSKGYRKQEVHKEPPGVLEGSLTTGAAAKRCGITGQTMREWIAAGQVKGYRIGPRNYRVPLSEVERILSEAGAA
jgi:excisionase family DNA binding protein